MSSTKLLPSTGMKLCNRKYWTLEATKKYKKKKKKEKKHLNKKKHLETVANSKGAKYIGKKHEDSNGNGQKCQNEDDDISHKKEREYSSTEEITSTKKEEDDEGQKIQKVISDKSDIIVPIIGSYKDKEGLKSWLEAKKQENGS
jgi:hypothetical protein